VVFRKKIQLNIVKEATMRKPKLLSALVFFLLSGPVVLVGQAYGQECCMCTWGCDSSCICPGTWPCAGPCAIADNSETVQSHPLTNDSTSGTTVVRKPAASIATNSHMLDRLIRLGQTGQCALNNFTLRLLADGQKLLKLDQMFLKAYASQDNTVALRITEKY